MAQPSPIQSWKLIVPSVVLAAKSGAVSFILSDNIYSPSFLFLTPVNSSKTGPSTWTAPLFRHRGMKRTCAQVRAVAARFYLSACLIVRPPSTTVMTIQPKKPMNHINPAKLSDPGEAKAPPTMHAPNSAVIPPTI